MSYVVRDYTLPPGQTVTVEFKGTVVAVYQASNDFLLAHGDNDPQYIEGGLKLKPQNGFTRIRMLNPHPADVTVKIGLSDGDIIDSRLSTSAPIEISGFSSTPTINVIDPNEYWKSLCEGFYETPNYQAWAKTPKHKIGQSFANGSVSTSPFMLIDPALNANGAILRSYSGYSGGYSSLHVDTSSPTGCFDGTKRRIWGVYDGAGQNEPNFLPAIIPSGNGLWVSFSASGGGIFSATWDYLQ